MTRAGGETAGAQALVVRPYEDADHDELVRLWRRVFPGAPPRNDPARNIRLKKDVQPELLLVATVAGRIAGATMAGYDGHRGWLYLVAVDPDCRRRGIGTALVRRAEALLLDLGCPKVNLQVFPANGEVVAFYERLGFRVEPRISMGKVVGERE